MDIGFIGAGEMGAGLAWAFGRAGHTCRAVASGRSAETQARMAEAGMEPVDDLAALNASSQVIFSVLPPELAEPEAQALAEATRDGGPLVFVEANAISPMRARRIAGMFGDNVRVIDGGIIGMPPSEDNRPRIYVSGPGADVLAPLDRAGIEICPLGDDIGRASAMKMTYAGLTKGTNALLTAVLLAGEQMDLTEALRQELSDSQPAMFAKAETTVPRLPADAGRWVFEMREIAETFRSEGVPGGFHDGAAEIMDLMAGSEFGHETRRSRDRDRTSAQTIAALARRLG